MALVLATLVVLDQLGDRLPFVGPSGPVDVVATVDDPSELTCPDPADFADVEGATLPAGAVTLRLCDADRDATGDSMPSTVLTAGVNEVVERVNGLPDDEDDLCPLVEQRYAVAFGYPDGAVRVIVGDGICDYLVTGERQRVGGHNVLQGVLTRLRAERGRMPDPTEPPPLVTRCTDPLPGAPTTLGVGPRELVRAEVCALRPDDSAPVRVSVPPAELGTLVAVLARDPSPASEDCGEREPTYVRVVGVNAQRDPLSFDSARCLHPGSTTPVTTADRRFFSRLFARAEPVRD